MKDLIDRHDAYKVLTEYYNHHTEAQHKSLKEALSMVPEAVVMCKDCKWWIESSGECQSPNYFIVPAGFFCGWGERRDDGT